jgi:hypothetical protein
VALELIGAVYRRGRQEPHDPWLFSPRGLDWTFVTWGEAAVLLETLAPTLAGTAGRRVAYPWRCRGEDWLFDLALCGAGASVVPVSEESAVGLVGEAVRRRAGVLADSSCPCFAPPPGERRRLAAGEWLVSTEAHGGEWWGEAEAARAVERLSSVLGTSRGRDIALSSGRLEEASVRAFLSWATVSGAAVLFEPSRHRFLATVRWARPTVLLVSTAVRRELAGELGAARRRRLDGRRGRLRTLVLAEPGDLRDDERALWDAARVRLVSP